MEMMNDLKPHPDNTGEEKHISPWLENLGIKLLPLLFAAGALFVFLKYGALIALMMIFSGVVAFYIVVFTVKGIKTLKRK